MFAEVAGDNSGVRGRGFRVRVRDASSSWGVVEFVWMSKKTIILVPGIAPFAAGIGLLIKAVEANLGHINKDGPTWHRPVGWMLLGISLVLFVVAALTSE
jgi:hypothetical protein